jgi:hypothetical protein
MVESEVMCDRCAVHRAFFLAYVVVGKGAGWRVNLRE